ncbi:MAG: hypothetical protein QWI73_06620 [Alphaproteobacteria bacterium]|nr:hypothetical protein [Alphaproteobacteria bacterium]
MVAPVEVMMVVSTDQVQKISEKQDQHQTSPPPPPPPAPPPLQTPPPQKGAEIMVKVQL